MQPLHVGTSLNTIDGTKYPPYMTYMCVHVMCVHMCYTCRSMYVVCMYVKNI